MTYTQIEIQTTNQAQSEILIALLANIGFEGFEEKENTLQAFIKKEDFIDALDDYQKRDRRFGKIN